MAQSKIYRLEVLGAIAGGNPTLSRLYRLEVLGTAGTGPAAQARLRRLEVLGTGTTGTNPQSRLYRLEVSALKRPIWVLDKTTDPLNPVWVQRQYTTYRRVTVGGTPTWVASS